MSDDARIRDLEQEVARLRRLLDARGVPATLRHQTRNALALMRAILRRSAETASSVEDYAAHLEGRFDALLRVQTPLIAGGDDALDLHMLIADELVAYTIREGAQATLDGPVVDLSPKSAEVLGLAIHELTVNAIKFGAMTVPDGQIAISWSVSGSDRPMLDLSWSESGLAGLIPPSFRGFGIETLEKMLPYQIDASSRLEFRPEGLHCVIRLPLSPTSKKL